MHAKQIEVNNSLDKLSLIDEKIVIPASQI